MPARNRQNSFSFWLVLEFAVHSHFWFELNFEFTNDTVLKTISFQRALFSYHYVLTIPHASKPIDIKNSVNVNFL